MIATDLDNLNDEIRHAYETAVETLDSRNLSAEHIRNRIEGIHQRLTQNLVMQFGLMNAEVSIQISLLI